MCGEVVRMSSEMRAELSKKNPYWLEKHRYYELKHFCLQYPIWKQTYESLDMFGSNRDNLVMCRDKYGMSNPTERIGIIRYRLRCKMDLIEEIAKESDDTLAKFLILGITKGKGYTELRMRYDIPCCKDTYYDRYRRFFWLLNKRKD